MRRLLTGCWLERKIACMLTVTQAAAKLRLSEDRVRKLLQEGRIKGATKHGMMWVLPDKIEFVKPLDVKYRRKK